MKDRKANLLMTPSLPTSLKPLSHQPCGDRVYACIKEVARSMERLVLLNEVQRASETAPSARACNNVCKQRQVREKGAREQVKGGDIPFAVSLKSALSLLSVILYSALVVNIRSIPK